MANRLSNIIHSLGLSRASLKGEIGFAFIVVLALVALGGAYLRPDHTPMANLQHPSLSRLSPFSKVKFLEVRKNTEISNVSWHSQFLLGGKIGSYELVPYEEIEFQGNRVKLKLKSTLGVEEYRFYSYIDILYPVSSKTIANYAKTQDGQFKFIDVFGQTASLITDDAEAEIKNHALTTKLFLLGSDQYGRDLLSRLMAGSVATITIGFLSILIALVVGVGVGVFAGYFGGWVDRILSWLINVFWSVPAILLVIAIAMLLGQGMMATLLGIGAILWVEMAQIVRGEVKSIREREFIKAAHLMGLSDLRIIFSHVLPNISGTVVVLSVSNFAEAVLLESGLSFLGVGVQPPVPSWGNMIRESYGYIITDGAFMAIFPGLAIAAVVLAFASVGRSFNRGTLLFQTSNSVANT